MAIIKSNKSIKKEKIKVDMNSEVLAKIKEYCQWAQIENIDFFIEESALFVLAKDKEWKEHQRPVKRTKKQPSEEHAL
ncbi:MAG: hypothetical protein H0U75_11745 [Legionella sp.]|nr:hypothetical protein [Legionella sp.]